jgi:hypothetical protein
MNLFIFLPFMLMVLLCGPVYARSGQVSDSVTPQIQELLPKMLGDDQVMALLLTLLKDPEMQALLSDPALLEAIQAGDLAGLAANPRFLKLLDNATVKEIQKRIVE